MKLEVPFTPNQTAWNRKAQHSDSLSSSRNGKIASFLPSNSNSSISMGKNLLAKSLNSNFEEAFNPSPRASLDLESRGRSHDLTLKPAETENEGEETSVDVIALVKESVEECKRSVKNVESLSAEIKINEKKNEQIFWAKLQAGISLFVILPLLGLGLKAGIMFFCGEEDWISHGFVPT